ATEPGSSGREAARTKPTGTRGNIIKVATTPPTAPDIIECPELDQALDERGADAQAAEQRTAAILESLTDGFFAVEAQGRMTYVNAVAERVLQRQREELVGREAWEMFPAGVGSPFQDAYQRVVAARLPSTVEAFYPPLQTWFEARMHPAEDGGVIVYFADVTARKRTEAERAELLERERAARTQAKAALAQAQVSEQLFRATFEHAAIGIAHVALDGRLLRIND